MSSFLQDEEGAYRERLLALLERIPRGVPAGWERERYAVGGLRYIGFSAVQTEKLICVSSQGQRVIDCKTGEKLSCDGDFDEDSLIACAGLLGDELVPLAGEGGGALRRFGGAGDALDTAAPFWPREQVIFMPGFVSWYQNPEACAVIFDDYALRAFGFSRCGSYFAVACSHTLDIYRRTGEKAIQNWRKS